MVLFTWKIGTLFELKKPRKLFDATVTQPEDDITQWYHRYMPKHARTKANIFHIVSHELIAFRPNRYSRTTQGHHSKTYRHD